MNAPAPASGQNGGQRFAVYELARPDADGYFAGRIDP
jgi:hypothetical protein